MPRDIPVPHPGSVLKSEFLDPLGLSIYALAKAVDVPRSRLNDICKGRQAITAGMALRLGRFFDVDPRWFMNMQAKHDLTAATGTLGETLDRIAPYRPAAE